MIFALTNQKGGVGKSTIAVHLCAWLQRRGSGVALIDCDVQASSSVWLHEAAPEIPVFRLQTPEDILDRVPAIAKQFEYLVIDGPAGLSEVTRTVLLLADVAFLPCGPSALDLRAANDAIRVVGQVQSIRKGPPQSVLIPNKLQVQTRLSQELLETARSLAIPTTAALRLRQPYADAAGQGTVVWRLGRAAQAAKSEVEKLMEELICYESTQPSILDRSAGNG